MGVGVVAALAMEVRALGPKADRNGLLTSRLDGSFVAVGGIGGVAATRAARSLVDRGATALASWGLAGGLDPALAAGTVCLPGEVLGTDGSSFLTDAPWRELLQARIETERTVANGRLLTSSRALETIDAKAAAFRDTGAAAVDMESLSVARIAAQCGLPFLAIRVIVDTAHDMLPPVVMRSSASGSLHLWRLLGAIALAPAQVPALLQLGRRFRAARGSLAAVARSGPLAPPAARGGGDVRVS